MMSQQHKAGEEIEMMEATAEAVAEEVATAAEAAMVVMTMIEVMEETLGEEEEEEEAAEVEEEAEVDIKTEITEEVMEIEDMTTEIEVATTMMITAEAGVIEVEMEEVTPMETNTNLETTITTVAMMTKASLDQIQLSLLSEEDLLNSLDKDLLLQSKLVP
jgi:hypothetical protein